MRGFLRLIIFDFFKVKGVRNDARVIGNDIRSLHKSVAGLIDLGLADAVFGHDTRLDGLGVIHDADHIALMQIEHIGAIAAYLLALAAEDLLFGACEYIEVIGTVVL